VETALLALVMQHYNGRYPQWMLAVTARAHLAVKILNKPIGEMILSAGAAGRLGAVRPAVRTSKLDAIIKRIAIQRSPSCVTDSHGFR